MEEGADIEAPQYKTWQSEGHALLGTIVRVKEVGEAWSYACTS
jgi:hypothetical protein